MVSVSALGAVVALSVAIFLILKKVPPAYGMIAGALIGGLIGGADLAATVKLMIEGAQGITTAVMRILAAGVLAGVLIESGAATTIAEKAGRAAGFTGTGCGYHDTDCRRRICRRCCDYRFAHRAGTGAPCGFVQTRHFAGDDRRR